MRNRLVHDYFDINLERVWETARQDIPRLISPARATRAPGGRAVTRPITERLIVSSPHDVPAQPSRRSMTMLPQSPREVRGRRAGTRQVTSYFAQMTGLAAPPARSERVRSAPSTPRPGRGRGCGSRATLSGTGRGGVYNPRSATAGFE